MVEVTKAVKSRGVMGDQKYVVYELTNATNGTTITTPFHDAVAWFGTNEVTADKPFGASKAITNGKAVLTLIISTTTDEYRVTVIGK